MQIIITRIIEAKHHLPGSGILHESINPGGGRRHSFIRWIASGHHGSAGASGCLWGLCGDRGLIGRRTRDRCFIGTFDIVDSATIAAERKGKFLLIPGVGDVRAISLRRESIVSGPVKASLLILGAIIWPC